MLKRDPVDDQHCEGVTFAVTDADALAHAIALVLVQEYALARSILFGTATSDGEGEVALSEAEIGDIVARRLRPTDTYHRDGFLFQLIMWLAAHLDLGDGDLVALPHAQASAKGQDSIVVHRDHGAVVALSICEDKATENPRDTIREQVWPEIREYEGGGRRDELRSNIIATLGLGGIAVDEAVQLIRKISWENRRRYRVRVTLEAPRSSNLFKGFEEIVEGSVDRRRGETFHIHRLREWMTEFAAKVEAELRRYIREARHV